MFSAVFFFALRWQTSVVQNKHKQSAEYIHNSYNCYVWLWAVRAGIWLGACPIELSLNRYTEYTKKSPPPLKHFSTSNFCSKNIKKRRINRIYVRILKRSSAVARGPRDAPYQLTPCEISNKCSSNWFDNSCNRRMIFKVIQGHWKWHESIGHIILPISGV